MDAASLALVFTEELLTTPHYVGPDNNPLYRFHPWEANLRVLDVIEVNTVPSVPFSHPFVDQYRFLPVAQALSRPLSDADCCMILGIRHAHADGT